MGGEDETPGRVDREVPGGLPADRRVARRSQAAARSVDPEDGEAVVAAVRTVDEAAVRRDGDLGREARPGEARRQRRDRLDRREHALLRVVREDADRGEELVDGVEELPARAKRQVARAGARVERHRTVGLEAALRRAEAVDEDPVGPEVGREGESLRGIEVDAVGVRLVLPCRVRSGSLVGADEGGGLQPPVRFDGQHGDVAPAVVRDEEGAAGLVHDEVAGAGPLRRPLVEQRQVARLRVDGEGTHRPRLRALEARDLPHRVEEAPARVEGEKGGVPGLRGEDGLRHGAAGAVEGEAVDPTARAVRIRADVDGHGVGLRGRRGDRGGRREGEQEGGRGEGGERVGHGRDPAPVSPARQRAPMAPEPMAAASNQRAAS